MRRRPTAPSMSAESLHDAMPAVLVRTVVTPFTPTAAALRRSEPHENILMVGIHEEHDPEAEATYRALVIVPHDRREQSPACAIAGWYAWHGLRANQPGFQRTAATKLTELVGAPPVTAPWKDGESDRPVLAWGLRVHVRPDASDPEDGAWPDEAHPVDVHLFRSARGTALQMDGSPEPRHILVAMHAVAARLLTGGRKPG